MVQGLAFLSKKSWHTKNLNNQEKVWIAEQRKAAEETKTKELARQIQQEREREEFDRMAGKKTHLDRGIDWMYQGQAVTGNDSKPSAVEQENAAKRAEEFLLGKEYVGEGSHKGDFAEGADGVNAVVKLEPTGLAAAAAAAATSTKESAYGEPSVADRNEAFRQRVEDPMYMVSQKEREKKIESRKQQALYERVVGPVRGNESVEDGGERGRDSGRKNSKHERKSERKERRRREKAEKEARKKKRRRSDESDEPERKRHRRRDRHDRKESKYDSDSDHERRHRRKQRSRSRDDEDRKTGSERLRDNRRRSCSRSGSPEKSRHRRYDREQERPRNCRDGDHSYRRDEGDGRRNHHHQSEDRPMAKSGYGLLGKSSSSSTSKRLSPQDLGPAQDLLRQKRQTIEDEKRRARELKSSRRQLTAEERAHALREMQAAAQARSRDTSARARPGDNDDELPTQGKAIFLKDLTEQTHGIKGPSHSLASRMAQNNNTQQRLHDDAFL